VYINNIFISYSFIEGNAINKQNFPFSHFEYQKQILLCFSGVRTSSLFSMPFNFILIDVFAARHASLKIYFIQLY